MSILTKKALGPLLLAVALCAPGCDLSAIPGLCSDDSACDDGLPCTVGTCAGGLCKHGVIQGKCLISNTCYNHGAQNPLSVCQSCNTTMTQKGWSAANEGGACDDQNDCTFGDTCAAGVCAGTVYKCTPGTNQTCLVSGSCTGKAPNKGGCAWVYKSGTCFIDNSCYQQGDKNPQNPCLFCDPSRSQTAWSPVPGCTQPAVCGNNVVESGEECDGGVGGKTCQDLGFTGGTLRCRSLKQTNPCTYDTSGCTRCGNGVIESGEECDGAALGGKSCGNLGFASGSPLLCRATTCTFDTVNCNPWVWGIRAFGVNYGAVGSYSYGYVGGVSVDSSGNIYVGGGGNGNHVLLGPTVKKLYNTSGLSGVNDNYFTARINPATGKPDWIAGDAAGVSSAVTGLAVDDRGVLHGTGVFMVDLLMPVVGMMYGERLTSDIKNPGAGNQWDLFQFQQRSSDGGYSTVTSPFIAAGGHLEANDLALDSAGNAYVVGNMTSWYATFGGHSVSQKGEQAIFVARFNKTQKAWAWARVIGGSAKAYGSAIAVDGNRVQVGGSTTSCTVTSGSLTRVATACNNKRNLLLASFDLQGSPTGLSLHGGYGDEAIHDLTSDGAGGLYIAGEFEGTLPLGSGITLTASTAGSATNTDSFVARVTSSGGFTWAWSPGASGSLKADQARAVAADGKGVYVGGAFEGTLTIGNAQLSATSTSADLYVARFDTAGKPRWATSGGGTGDDRVDGLAARSDGVAVVGFHRSKELLLGSTVKVTNFNTSAPDTNGFVALLKGP